jgi:hypothetical protein
MLRVGFGFEGRCCLWAMGLGALVFCGFFLDGFCFVLFFFGVVWVFLMLALVGCFLLYLSLEAPYAFYKISLLLIKNKK